MQKSRSYKFLILGFLQEVVFEIDRNTYLYIYLDDIYLYLYLYYIHIYNM